jgi:hypothetical protein
MFCLIDLVDHSWLKILVKNQSLKTVKLQHSLQRIELKTIELKFVGFERLQHHKNTPKSKQLSSETLLDELD